MLKGLRAIFVLLLFTVGLNIFLTPGTVLFQLGFLKVLAGTPLARQLQAHGIVYRDHAPYEVIATDYIKAEELVRLKMIENMVDVYYNRGGYEKTLDYLIDALGKGAFGFFENLAEFYYESGFQHASRKKEDQYRILFKFSRKLSTDGTVPQADIKALATLDADMQQTMNPDTYKRFLRKGWEI